MTVGFQSKDCPPRFLEEGRRVALLTGLRDPVHQWVARVAQAAEVSLQVHLDWAYKLGYAEVYYLGDAAGLNRVAMAVTAIKSTSEAKVLETFSV